ncbi:hypothetical protein QAD02_016001 [Eretmocerus hayati]|uniref:Uncharacterized protein n=1 Tax=Eretmocerus hayati TaxID=131215 RepID=A0ACC2P9C7_9HYME|nr:hypothetical protein QAD02_016001 [Eretmocerus hayati]
MRKGPSPQLLSREGIIYVKMQSIEKSLHVVEFKDDVLRELSMDLNRIRNVRDSRKLEKLIEWLSRAPKNTVFRINTILCTQNEAYSCIKKSLNQNLKTSVIISTFENIPELIIINGWEYTHELPKLSKEIIVDSSCGSAILRGAHIYAPGVLGMPCNLNQGDHVSVYVDLKQNCKKGLIKQYDSHSKLFVGNGVVRMTRESIFKHTAENISGIAISMTDVISGVPQLNDELLPSGHILLQNLPSIICVRILDPRPGEIILDMCAAPGNKTTHISSLMKNQGTVIALEKIKSKVEKLRSNLKIFHAENVRAFCFDSTKAVCNDNNRNVVDGPPFYENTFDKILLDGPCSALGQRPQLCNNISCSQLRSYVPLQRKLFTTAVQLLKPSGILVYSTCTITIAENEGIVAWALSKFPKLELVAIRKKLSALNFENFPMSGYEIDGLTPEQSEKLCRFGVENDFVGFFIACFVKT